MSYTLRTGGKHAKNCGGPGQPRCREVPRGFSGDGAFMVDPGARLYASGLGATAGGVVGTVVDVVTSRAGALTIAGVLTYLLIKSPAARKELWGTTKGHFKKKDKLAAQPAAYRTR